MKMIKNNKKIRLAKMDPTTAREFNLVVKLVCMKTNRDEKQLENLENRDLRYFVLQRVLRRKLRKEFLRNLYAGGEPPAKRTVKHLIV